ARILEAPGALKATQLRRVERLMRIAIALAGEGQGMPYVAVHGLPPATGEALPEIRTIDLTDLMAERAAAHLPGAPQGNPEALRALEQEAERIIVTEDIQLI